MNFFLFFLSFFPFGFSYLGLYEFRLKILSSMKQYTLVRSCGGNNEYGKISDHKKVNSDCKIMGWHMQINSKQFRTANI